jgi:uncharacterized protein YfaP (DUF2135 family)
MKMENPMSYLAAVRRSATRWILLALVAMLALGASAQGATTLIPGTPVVGEVSADSPLQVYAFNAVEGDRINIGVTAQPGLSLSLAVVDAAGAVLAVASDSIGSGAVSALDVPLSEGINFIQVFIAAGSSAASGAYRIILEGSAGDTTPVATPDSSDAATPAPDIAATPEPIATTTAASEDLLLGQVLTTAGLQIDLSWASTADLNLELRDPTGARLYFDSRTNTNGGVFGFDVNGLCEVLTANAPTENASYSPGAIPVGSYEVLVYYREECESNGPQDFSVSVTVDGQQLDSFSGRLPTPVNGNSPVYIGSFTVRPDGSAALNPQQGLYQDTRILPITTAEIAALPAQDVAAGDTVSGVITGTGSYFDLYRFEGQTNDVLSISMSRASGNLDTLLLVIDPNGQIVADSDDIVAGQVTDSAINNPPLRLSQAGTYTIFATRYGKDVGGTAGQYTLTLSSQTVELPQDVLDLNLPTGDIQVALVWNTNADLQLLVRDPSGASVYDDQRSVPSGGRIEALGNINCTVALTTPVSYIYWPTGLGRGGSYEVEVWYQNQCNDTRPVNATVNITVNGQVAGSLPVSLTPGQRFVTSFVIDGAGRASVGLGGVLGGSETLNFASEIDTAPLIAYGQVARASISETNKFDVYVFDGTAGDIVNIAMQASQGSLDTNLFLISPSLFEVAANDDSNPGEVTDSLIDAFTLPETGRYIILATHFGTIYGGTTGTYSLTLTAR